MDDWALDKIGWPELMLAIGLAVPPEADECNSPRRLDVIRADDMTDQTRSLVCNEIAKRSAVNFSLANDHQTFLGAHIIDFPPNRNVILELQ